MDDDRSDRPAVGAGLLESLLAHALGLARRARDHLLRGAGDTANRDPLDALLRAVVLGRITTRLTASIAWLLARRAVAAGELDPESARDARWRLFAIADLSDEAIPAGDPELERLARDSAALYARLQRLDAALDSEPALRH